MGKTCSKCGKPNHFAVVCRSKAEKLDSVTATPASVALMHIEALPAHSTESIFAMKVNGKEVLMQVDTGAAASLISEKIWRSLGSPPLQPSNRLLSAYDGHRMKPLGELACQLEANGTCLNQASLTVVQSFKTYGLLGRDLLSNFVTLPLNSGLNAVESLETLCHEGSSRLHRT